MQARKAILTEYQDNITRLVNRFACNACDFSLCCLVKQGLLIRCMLSAYRFCGNCFLHGELGVWLKVHYQGSNHFLIVDQCLPGKSFDALKGASTVHALSAELAHAKKKGQESVFPMNALSILRIIFSITQASDSE